MKTERWEIAETPEFVEDVVRCGIALDWVAVWRNTIELHPRIGERVENPGNLGIHRYEADGYIVHYIVLPERRWIQLMTVRKDDALLRSAERKLREIDHEAGRVAMSIAQSLMPAGRLQ